MSASSHAETFAQRGVCVPFTAPMLAVARVRAARDGGIELLLPNPSGARGVVVTDLAGATRLHGATLHDTLLCRRLAASGPPSPCTVREAALAQAAEGHAGHAAALAARQRLDSDAVLLTRTHAALLAPFPGGTDAAAARALGIPFTPAKTAIEALVGILAPIGLPPDTTRLPHHDTPRLPRTIAVLDHAGQAIAAWTARDPAHDPDGLGEPVAAMLCGAAAMGSAFLTGLRRHLADPPALVRRMLAQPAAVRAQLERAVWLLDGWERLALLWQAAETTAQRRLALLEIAHGRPVLPAEALSWTDPPVIPPPNDPHTRITYGSNTRLPNAAARALTRRNEALRAMSL